MPVPTFSAYAIVHPPDRLAERVAGPMHKEDPIWSATPPSHCCPRAVS
jgi:hypothetical protein